MTTVISTFEVDDGAKFLASTRREQMKMRGIATRIFTDPENPNRIILLMEMPDLDTALQGLNSAASRAAMVLDGVKMETFRLHIET
jgi:hypothetical protein